MNCQGYIRLKPHKYAINVTIHGLIFPAQKKTTPLDRFYYRPDGAVFFLIHIQQIFLRQYMGYHHIILLMHHIR